jgi:multiple antibiotic resistance protein
MAFLNGFLLAFSALLPMINPLGSALVFMSLVGSAPPKVYMSLARRIALNNIIFLGTIELVGAAILNFFGISLPIVEVSGGLVIAAIGWKTLNENDATAGAREKREECDEKDEVLLENLNQKLFYPFTFPITSGPGTLVTMLTLSAQASRHGMKANLLQHGGVFAAVVVLSLAVFLCYAYAPKITSKISQSTAHGILRVVAFILLCIGVQIAWNGLSELLSGLVKG